MYCWCAMTAGYFPIELAYTCSLRSALQTKHILSLELKFNMVECLLSSTWQGTNEGLGRAP